MMRVAFNGLSVDNLSGRHVLLGHLRQVIAASAGQQRHILLHHAGNRDLALALGNSVDAVECPPATRSWRTRWWWESSALPPLLQQHGAQALFSPAGVRSAQVQIPQLVLAQNPWCLVPEVHNGIAHHIKALAQRAAYRDAQRNASLMLYNSAYMQRIYEANAGSPAQASRLLLQGLDDDNYSAGEGAPGFAARRMEVLVVSVMARHKVIEHVVEAVAVLRKRGLEAGLKLVGPWADESYQRFIRQRIDEIGLKQYASIVGKVSREQLFQHYAQARVFCLLSPCESFGIPAVEGQAFGTPCVVANRGAPPEIAGPGGVVVPAGDIEAAADAMAPLLQSASAWEERSQAARTNVQRFRWERCSQPLVEWLGLEAANA